LAAACRALTRDRDKRTLLGDAVAWAEQHNNGGAAPFIELWPESKLETLLAQKPYLAAAHGLR